MHDWFHLSWLWNLHHSQKLKDTHAIHFLQLYGSGKACHVTKDLLLCRMLHNVLLIKIMRKKEKKRRKNNARDAFFCTFLLKITWPNRYFTLYLTVNFIFMGKSPYNRNKLLIAMSVSLVLLIIKKILINKNVFPSLQWRHLS